jgi:hypothetical protein
VWFVVEPSASGIGGGAATTGGRQRLRRPQRHEATARRVRGQGDRGGVRMGWQAARRRDGRGSDGFPAMAVHTRKQGRGDLGEAFPTGGARVDGQQLTAGSRGRRGPLGSEGREGKGEWACFRAWAGLVQRIRPRRKELFFLFSKEFPKIQE